MIDHELAMCAYVQLAVISDQKHQGPARDRFLLLAGVESCRAGWLDVADRCRALIVAANPAHQLQHHATMADALRDADFQQLAARWERYCPYEHAEHLLLQLGYSPEGDLPDLPRGERMLQLLNEITTG
jgi:predicted metal-dependent HD superfamily phosphohydrolase